MVNMLYMSCFGNCEHLKF